MPDQDDGLIEIKNFLEKLSLKCEKVLNSINEEKFDVQKIREDLVLKNTPQNIPLIESSKEEAENEIKKAGGVDEYIEVSFLIEDIGEYILNERNNI